MSSASGSSNVIKTPVTILHELCIRERHFTAFEDIPHGTDPKQFSCIATAFGLSAKGSGRSKKEAKHDACANLISEYFFKMQYSR